MPVKKNIYSIKSVISKKVICGVSKYLCSYTIPSSPIIKFKWLYSHDIPQKDILDFENFDKKFNDILRRGRLEKRNRRKCAIEEKQIQEKKGEKR